MSDNLPVLNLTAIKKAEEATKAPSFIECICEHITSGGSLTDLCKMWDISYRSVIKEIRKNKEWSELYDTALKDRDEWSKEELFNFVRTAATVDIADAYDSDGNIKPIPEWPSELRAALQSADQTVDKDGETVLKFKLYDKLKAVELYGKKLGTFAAQKVEHSGVMTLEQLVIGTNDEDNSKD